MCLRWHGEESKCQWQAGCVLGVCSHTPAAKQSKEVGGRWEEGCAWQERCRCIFASALSAQLSMFLKVKIVCCIVLMLPDEVRRLGLQTCRAWFNLWFWWIWLCCNKKYRVISVRSLCHLDDLQHVHLHTSLQCWPINPLLNQSKATHNVKTESQ